MVAKIMPLYCGITIMLLGLGCMLPVGPMFAIVVAGTAFCLATKLIFDLTMPQWSLILLLGSNTLATFLWLGACMLMAHNSPMAAPFVFLGGAGILCWLAYRTILDKAAAVSAEA